MSKRKKNALPFDSRGGVLVLPRRMVTSDAWTLLSPEAKVLLVLLQVHWRNDQPIAFGVREAATKIPCAKGTAQRAFNKLQEFGFIEMVDHSLFNSRLKSKSRTWRLTWLPWQSRSPTNDWEKTELPGQLCTRKMMFRVNKVPTSTLNIDYRTNYVPE